MMQMLEDWPAESKIESLAYLMFRSTIFKAVNDLIFQITLMLVVDAVITFTAWLPRSIGLVYAELNDKDINLVAGMVSWLIPSLIRYSI